MLILRQRRREMEKECGRGKEESVKLKRIPRVRKGQRQRDRQRRGVRRKGK